MLIKILNYIIKYSIYILVLLMPIFWLPYTYETYEFNKLNLLFFLTIIGLAAYLIKMFVAEKRFYFQRTPLDIPVVIFILAIILTAIFSKDWISSWLGYYGRFTDAVAGLLAMIVFYYLVINNISIIINKITALITASAGIVVITAYLSVNNLWVKLPLIGDKLPAIAKLQTFNLVAVSLEGLSIYLAMIAAVLVGLILVSFNKKERKFSNLYYGLLLAAVLILLIKINFMPVWISLAIAMFVLLVIAFWTKIFRTRINLLILPIVILIISIAGLAINFQSFFNLKDLPKEVILDYQTAKTVALKSFNSQPILGAGPGNYAYSFNKFKPDNFNESRFWNIRFDKGPSHLLELATTTGILGLLAYLGIIFSFIVLIIMGILRIKTRLPSSLEKPDSKEYAILISLPLIIGWLVLLISQALYLQNSILLFFFWLFTGLIIAVWQYGEIINFKKIKFLFEKSPELSLVLTTLLVLLCFVFLGLLYTAGKYYMADFNQAKLAKAESNDFDRQIEIVKKSADSNKYRITYKIMLSRLYLTKVWQEANKPQEQRNNQMIADNAKLAISQAQIATQISPNIINSWENLGMVWRDLRVLVSGAAEAAASAFDKAIELEPINPLFPRELCKLYLFSGAENDWDKTLALCQKAVSLKPNFLDAYVQLALVYERKNDIEEGIKKLETALDRVKGVKFQRGSELANLVAEIYFQLGRLHFNANRTDKAIDMFQQAIIAFAEHSNAHYGLAVAYEKKGMADQALEEYKLVAVLNPDNQILQQKIDQINAAKAAAQQAGQTEPENLFK